MQGSPLAAAQPGRNQSGRFNEGGPSGASLLPAPLKQLPPPPEPCTGQSVPSASLEK